MCRIFKKFFNTMASLKNFSIPVRGLKSGIHEYDFQLNEQFFASFADSFISEGDVTVEVDFDKRPDMFVLDMNIAGTIKTECDRCLANINLPIDGNYQLIIKLSDHKTDDAEVVYLPLETTEINIAKYIYEFVGLSVPMIKVYDCQDDKPIPCDQAVIDRLNAKEKEEQPGNPIWDDLNKLTEN